MDLPSPKVLDQPSHVEAEDGLVLLDCSEAEVYLTPDAAEETADRLHEQAMKARGQRYFDENRRTPRAE